jgi:hypothetical protein
VSFGDDPKQPFEVRLDVHTVIPDHELFDLRNDVGKTRKRVACAAMGLIQRKGSIELRVGGVIFVKNLKDLDQPRDVVERRQGQILLDQALEVDLQQTRRFKRVPSDSVDSAEYGGEETFPFSRSGPKDAVEASFYRAANLCQRDVARWRDRCPPRFCEGAFL